MRTGLVSLFFLFFFHSLVLSTACTGSLKWNIEEYFVPAFCGIEVGLRESNSNFPLDCADTFFVILHYRGP